MNKITGNHLGKGGIYYMDHDEKSALAAALRRSVRIVDDADAQMEAAEKARLALDTIVAKSHDETENGF